MKQHDHAPPCALNRYTTRMPSTSPTQRLAQLDHAHVWHPFTPMKQWRQTPPLIIERADGMHLIDTEGNRYIDGVSSLWCNVHGHRVPEIDNAIREQLDKVAHTTLLGLASPPSIELAAQLVERANTPSDLQTPRLNKVFYSDAGATALEVAFKMAVGYWYHTGQPHKNKFIGIQGAYHGDTTGSMSIGYSELFHKPFLSMVFETRWAPAPDCARIPRANSASTETTRSAAFPSQDAAHAAAVRDQCLAGLDAMLREHAHETAAIVIEPIMQGAAGMICQPAGYLRGVADLARRHNVLLIADEVATGFGRTGTLFACQQENVTPDILCLAKGITGGYLPLAATLTTDAIEQAFCGELEERRTLYHGHTYTGNPLACAAALASLQLFDDNNLLDHINTSSRLIAERLTELNECPHVLDIRQRGLMVGIELCQDRFAPGGAKPFNFAARTGAQLCHAMRAKGIIVRPLGDVIVLMPIPAMPHHLLNEMLDVVISTITAWN